jgi:hypothetical protein
MLFEDSSRRAERPSVDVPLDFARGKTFFEGLGGEQSRGILDKETFVAP